MFSVVLWCFTIVFQCFSWFVLSKWFIVLVAAEVSCFYPVPPVEQDHRGASRLAGTRCTWCMLPRFPSSWIRVAPRMRSSRRYKTPLGAAEKVMWVWINTYRYIFSGMNIHLPAILMFTRGTRFWPIPMCTSHILAPFLQWKSSKIWKHVVKCRWGNSWNSSSCPPSTV